VKTECLGIVACSVVCRFRLFSPATAPTFGIMRLQFIALRANQKYLALADKVGFLLT